MNAKAVFRKLEDGLHKFRHRIVKIQNNLCTEQLRNQCAKDQNVWHVVHMDKVVSLSQRTHRQVNKRPQNKRGILADISCLSTTLAPQWNTEDAHPIDNLTSWLVFIFLEAY